MLAPSGGPDHDRNPKRGNLRNISRHRPRHGKFHSDIRAVHRLLALYVNARTYREPVLRRQLIDQPPHLPISHYGQLTHEKKPVTGYSIPDFRRPYPSRKSGIEYPVTGFLRHRTPPDPAPRKIRDAAPGPPLSDPLPLPQNPS